jgi:ferredoxin
MCSKTRCRLCKEKGYKGRSCECGSSFTYGEYLAWKAKRTMNKVPDIDRWECTDCESCVNLLPDIFKRNEETGCIEVAEVADYPEEEIQRVMSMCPGHCITWQQP